MLVFYYWQYPPPPWNSLGTCRAHPPPKGVWMWTEAHVGYPSLRGRGMGGYAHRPTVGCGPPHDAVGIGTHNHRPTGYAGSAPTRGPHRTSKQKQTEHKPDTQTNTYGRKRGTSPAPPPLPRPERGYAGDERRRGGMRGECHACTTAKIMSRACARKCLLSTRVTRHTHKRPDAADLPCFLHIHACYDVSTPGTSSLLFFASEVHFDPLGLHARHAAILPPGGRVACEREGPCHSVGYPNAANLTSSSRSPLQPWHHVRTFGAVTLVPSSHR